MFIKLLILKKKVDELIFHFLIRDPEVARLQQRIRVRGVTRFVNIISWIFIIISFLITALLFRWFFMTKITVRWAIVDGEIVALNEKVNDTYFDISILKSLPKDETPVEQPLSSMNLGVNTNGGLAGGIKSIENKPELLLNQTELHLVSLASTATTDIEKVRLVIGGGSGRIFAFNKIPLNPSDTIHCNLSILTSLPMKTAENRSPPEPLSNMKLKFLNQTEVLLLQLVSLASKATSHVEYVTRVLVRVDQRIVVCQTDCGTPSMPFSKANKTIFPRPPQALMQNKLRKQQLKNEFDALQMPVLSPSVECYKINISRSCLKVDLVQEMNDEIEQN